MGSQADSAVRFTHLLASKMAVVDPVFQELLDKEGEEKRGLWRVQNLELVPVPEGHWGQFYDGDCYLLLDKNQEEEHVYFWIGDECSVDEQAVAAIKAVELDNLFGGLPVQHREAQGFESSRFKAVFPDGIMIKKGGMESGLKKAETNAHEAKLFKISGGMRPVMQEDLCVEGLRSLWTREDDCGAYRGQDEGPR